jgi:hypothetical protein
VQNKKLIYMSKSYKPRNLSTDLYYWLQIIEGLNNDEILELAASGVVKELETASTAISSVLAKRIPSKTQLN